MQKDTEEISKLEFSRREIWATFLGDWMRPEPLLWNIALGETLTQKNCDLNHTKNDVKEQEKERETEKKKRERETEKGGEIERERERKWDREKKRKWAGERERNRYCVYVWNLWERWFAFDHECDRKS